MAERIAFCSSPKAFGGLRAGRADVTYVHQYLMKPEYGFCNEALSILKPDCNSKAEYQEELENILQDWNIEDQLILYFSGHGTKQYNEYCLKFGEARREWLPFNNLMSDVKRYGVSKAIIILDACFSGAATKGDETEELLDSLPRGISYLASSGERQVSEEAADGSVSVFTALLCDAFETGLGGKATSNDLLNVEQVCGYVNGELNNNPEYSMFPQRAAVKIEDADDSVWLSRNVTKKSDEANDKHIPSAAFSEVELKFLAEQSEELKKIVPGTSSSDLDVNLVIEYLKNIGIEEADNSNYVELSKQKGLFYPYPEPKYLHRAAVLCFCKRPEVHLPQATAVVTRGDIGSPTFHRMTIYGPISEQVEQIFDAVVAELKPASTIGRGGKRVDDYEVPSELLREIVSNSVIHRDYSSTGRTQVNIKTNEIEIVSPGEFPGELNWESMLSTKSPMSVPRNPAVVQYARDQKVCEQIGRGFVLIREFLSQYGEQSIHQYPENGFTVIKIRRPDISDLEGKSQPSRVSKQEIWPLVSSPNFAPDRLVVGREAELDVIKSRLLDENKSSTSVASSPSIVVQSSGGMGKSTLARQYASSHRSSYKVIWWLAAESRQSLIEGLCQLGFAMNLPNVRATDFSESLAISVLSSVQADEDPSLLIYDNVTSYKDVRGLVPESPNTHVLFTSRARDWPERVKAHVISSLHLDAATDLLMREANRAEDHQGAARLAEVLGGLPLALVQAGRWLRDIPSESFDGYSRRLEEHLRSAPSMVGDYPDSVSSAVSLSIDRLSPEAKDVIGVFAYLSPDDLWSGLFEGFRSAALLTNSEAQSAIGSFSVFDDRVKIDMAFAELERRSLIDHHSEYDAWKIHRVTQAVLRGLIEGEDYSRNRDELVGAACAAVLGSYPDDKQGSSDELPTYARLNPHVSSLTTVTATESVPHLMESLLERSAWYYRVMRQDRMAVKTDIKRLRILQHRQNDVRFCEALMDFSTDLMNLGKPRFAGRASDLALKFANENGSFPDMKIAFMYLKNGQQLLQRSVEFGLDPEELHQARVRFHQVLRIFRPAYGRSAREVGRILDLLGSVHQSTGRHGAARVMLMASLNVYRRALSPSDARIALTCSNLGLNLLQSGRSQEAIPLLEEALAISEAAFSANPQHPQMLASAKLLAVALAKEREIEKADEVLSRHGLSFDVAKEFIESFVSEGAI